MPRLGSRSRVDRVLLLLFVTVVAVGVVATLALVRSAARTGGPTVAAAFLSDLRDGRFQQAYERLCWQEQQNESRSDFVSRLAVARQSGQGLADYRYGIPFDRETLSSHVALGTATFTDASTGDLTLELGKRGSAACVGAWRLGPLAG